MIKTGMILIGMFIVGIAVGIGGKQFQSSNVQGQKNKQQVLSMMTSVSVPTPTPTPKIITLMAVGDIMLSRSVDEQMKQRQDWTWPFASTAGMLRKADITMGNLETPMLAKCPVMTNRMIFCAENKSLAGLNLAGFDALSLANNHIFNQGKGGLAETERLVERAGIRGVREGELEIMEKEGVKFGILTYDDVSKSLNSEGLKTEIASAAAQVQELVGMVHWGIEYVDKPTPRQIDLAHLMVDAGMKVILGSHPHWTQTVETYNDGLIFYSLGNFVFDQMWSEETRRGYAADLRFKIQDLRITSVDYELLPVKIFEYGQPRWMR